MKNDGDIEERKLELEERRLQNEERLKEAELELKRKELDIKLEGEKSKWRRISTNPIIPLVLGFLLTGLVGTWLTYFYNTKQRKLEFALNEKQRDREREKDKSQKELERERAFAVELSKTRVAKINEVWEKVYLYEMTLQKELAGVDKLLKESPPKSPTPTPAMPEVGMALAVTENVIRMTQIVDNLKKSTKLMEELEEIIAKNRFWIGEDSYVQINNYIEITTEYIGTLEMGEPGKRKLEELNKKRERFRVTLVEIRNRLFRE